MGKDTVITLPVNNKNWYLYSIMKLTITFLLILGCLAGHSQSSINNYKYVLVPEIFPFLKQPDLYRLNSLAKSLLQDMGFTAYYDNNELPSELANNKCNALQAEVTSRNSMFATRLTLLLKDCKGNVVFKSKEGVSREKEFAPSYRMALEDAFSSLKQANYVYQPAPNTNNQPQPITPVVNPAPAQNIPATGASIAAGTLYAQPISNGYQLIDTTPKTILRIFKTSVSNYFIAENESAHGIVFKSDDSWIFEYYKDGKLMAEKLLIKF